MLCAWIKHMYLKDLTVIGDYANSACCQIKITMRDSYHFFSMYGPSISLYAIATNKSPIVGSCCKLQERLQAHSRKDDNVMTACAIHFSVTV